MLRLSAPARRLSRTCLVMHAAAEAAPPVGYQFVRFVESVPISISPILFTPLFAVTMLPWAVAS